MSRSQRETEEQLVTQGTHLALRQACKLWGWVHVEASTEARVWHSQVRQGGESGEGVVGDACDGVVVQIPATLRERGVNRQGCVKCICVYRATNKLVLNEEKECLRVNKARLIPCTLPGERLTHLFKPTPHLSGKCNQHRVLYRLG